MTHTLAPPRRPIAVHPRVARRFGFLVAIAVNLALIYVVRHLVAWQALGFLTNRFDELVPLITVSLAATVVANALFLVWDVGWFRSLANATTAAISFVVAARTYQVFPFDFSTYERDWSGLFRVAIVLCAVATAIAFVAEIVNVVTWPMRQHPDGR